MQTNPVAQTKKRWQGVAAVGILLLLGLFALFGLSLRHIYKSVTVVCLDAQGLHPGDKVEALLALIKSDNASFKAKNRAIWALGQIGSKRALPLLRELDTPEVQPKPYDSSAYIVQYSVEKAITQIESNISLTRWMYKNLR